LRSLVSLLCELDGHGKREAQRALQWGLANVDAIDLDAGAFRIAGDLDREFSLAAGEESGVVADQFAELADRLGFLAALELFLGERDAGVECFCGGEQFLDGGPQRFGDFKLGVFAFEAL